MNDWASMFDNYSDMYIKEFKSRLVDGVKSANALTLYIQCHLPKIRKIMEIPCGIGRLSILLAKNGFDLLGLDYSEVFVESTHTYYKRNGASLNELGKFSSKILLYDSSELIKILQGSGWEIINVSNSVFNPNEFDPLKDRILSIARNLGV